MIVLDTSIWADHFRSTVGGVVELIQSQQIIQHPFVTGELSLGNPADRRTMVAMLDAFPQAPIQSHADLMTFVERRALGGTGIGFVDANLLASAVAVPGGKVWTKDKRLFAQAERLGLAYTA